MTKQRDLVLVANEGSIEDESVPNTGSTAEREFLAQAREGNAKAFEILAMRIERRVFAFLTGWLRDRDAAHDVLQEATLKAFASISQCEPGAAFRPWFFQIAVNAAKDRARSLHRRQVRENQWVEGRAPSQPRQTLRLSAAEALEAGLSGLGDTERQLLLMRFVEDMSIAEIGKALGMSQIAVTLRLHRARAKFRKSVRESIGDES